MKTANLTFLFLLPLFLGFDTPKPQDDWKLVKNKDGIRVYQRDSPTSAFKNIKVECTFQGNFDKLITIISNVSRYNEWVYNNKQASVLKRIGPHEFYYYTEAYLPWPLDNRDAVMHTRITRDEQDRFLKIYSTAAPNYIPRKTGKVRITKSVIQWTVTKPANNALHIIYTFETDPGGSVPSWLVNSFADKGPYESFRKLSELLRK